MKSQSPVKSVEKLYAVHSEDIAFLEGKLLTLVDASIPDQEQRKALKDIVRQTVWNWAIGISGRVSFEHVEFPDYAGSVKMPG